MHKLIQNFCKNESGAVTIDWIIMTAAVVGIWVAGGAAMETSTSSITSETAVAMNAADATTTIGS